MTARPILAVEGLRKHFALTSGLFGGSQKLLKAVDDVSFNVAQGETLGLVGESGCGKSTVGKLIMGLVPATGGSVRLGEDEMTAASGQKLRDLRRRIQMVFQDPYSSLNPRMRAAAIVAEPILNYERIDQREREERVAVLFDKVGLRRDAMHRFPFEFSGGQRQRLGIARALALSPSVIVADEPVSALDVSVQAQVINLLEDLQADLGLAFLFISHDLAVVEHIAHRVAVMYLGRIVEIGPKKSVFAKPQHPYTRALISAAPVADPRAKRERIVLQGEVPSPVNPPSGCTFHTRCPFAFDRCKTEVPHLEKRDEGHLAACHLAG